jgi:hypothetical protein
MLAEAILTRADWLLAGDDGPEDFFPRLEESLKKIEPELYK